MTQKQGLETERRKYIKRAVGIGTLVWLTPTIISVTTNRSYADLSGGQPNNPDNNSKPVNKKMEPKT